VAFIETIYRSFGPTLCLGFHRQLQTTDLTDAQLAESALLAVYLKIISIEPAWL
jgi:hypothetical protein